MVPVFQRTLFSGLMVIIVHAHKKEREKNLSENQVSTPSKSNKFITPQRDVNLLTLDLDDHDKGHQVENGFQE